MKEENSCFRKSCEGNFEILKASSAKTFIIAGFASTPRIDKEQDIIEVDALKKDFPRFMNNVLYRNISLRHTNVQVGTVIDSFTDSSGKEWQTGVTGDGFFVVSMIRDDIQKGRETRELIEDGKIQHYSIAGTPTDFNYFTQNNRVVRRITGVEIYEIAVAEKPKNVDSSFDLLKGRRIKRIYVDSLDQVPGQCEARLGTKGLYFEVVI